MNRRRFHILAALVSVAIGFSGCATVPAKVQSEFDPATDFTAFKTFAVARMDTRSAGTTPGETLRVGPAMRSAAREVMIAKGFAEADEPANADLVIRIHSRLVPKTEVTDWGFQPNYGSYRWYRRFPYAVYGSRHVTVESYTEGTLIVEAHDVRTREMVWVGWITGPKEEREDEVREASAEAIRRILAMFPGRGQLPAPP